MECIVRELKGALKGQGTGGEMAYLVSSSSSSSFFLSLFTCLFEGGDITENVQKILSLPFYIMFLKCFLIPLYFTLLYRF